MANSHNQFEQGIEGVGGAASSAVGSAVKGVGDQLGSVEQDLFNQFLYGASDTGQGESGEQGVEGVGQAKFQKAAVKAGKNYGKKMAAPFSWKGVFGFEDKSKPMSEAARKRREQAAARGKTPEEIEEDEKLLMEAHNRYFQELTQPKHQKEESAAEKNEREDQEKKQKIQVKQYEEVKKEQDLAVVRKQTSIENKNPGAG
jgi:hypothetical protein